jgi:hypothetical protein
MKKMHSTLFAARLRGMDGVAMGYEGNVYLPCVFVFEKSFTMGTLPWTCSGTVQAESTGAF